MDCVSEGCGRRGVPRLAFIIGAILLQILMALLRGRPLPRRGRQKSLAVTVSALPIPAMVLALGLYLFPSAPLTVHMPIAPRQAQWRQQGEVALMAGTAVLYFLGFAVVRLAVRFTLSARPDHLGEIFE